MGRQSAREEGEGRGRHRGVHHDQEASLHETRTKGHDHKSSGLGANETPEISDPNTERGHQKGYGKNQDEEGRARHTRWGTRAPGSEHG